MEAVKGYLVKLWARIYARKYYYILLHGCYCDSCVVVIWRVKSESLWVGYTQWIFGEDPGRSGTDVETENDIRCSEEQVEHHMSRRTQHLLRVPIRWGEWKWVQFLHICIYLFIYLSVVYENSPLIFATNINRHIAQVVVGINILQYTLNP